jgi:hypothetical protein
MVTQTCWQAVSRFLVLAFGVAVLTLFPLKQLHARGRYWIRHCCHRAICNGSAIVTTHMISCMTSAIPRVIRRLSILRVFAEGGKA